MTRITQAIARLKMSSVSLQTNNSSDTSIAVVYISAGRLGGLSAASSAVQALTWPIQSGSRDSCWSKGTLPNVSNMLRTTLKDSGTVLRNSLTTKIIHTALHVINDVFASLKGIPEYQSSMELQPSLKWLPGLKPVFERIGTPSCKQMKPPWCWIVQSLNELCNRQTCRLDDIWQQECILLAFFIQCPSPCIWGLFCVLTLSLLRSHFQHQDWTRLWNCCKLWLNVWCLAWRKTKKVVVHSATPHPLEGHYLWWLPVHQLCWNISRLFINPVRKHFLKQKNTLIFRIKRSLQLRRGWIPLQYEVTTTSSNWGQTSPMASKRP